MIVLDASVIIGHLDADHQNAVTLMSALADQPSSARPITVAEVLVGLARAGQLDRAVGALEAAETSGGRVATFDDRLATGARDRGLAAPTP